MKMSESVRDFEVMQLLELKKYFHSCADFPRGFNMFKTQSNMQKISNHSMIKCKGTTG